MSTFTNNKMTDFSENSEYFYSYILIAPLLFFVSAVSFEEKNMFGGYGANLYIMITVPLFVSVMFAVFRKMTFDKVFLALILMQIFLFIKCRSYDTPYATVLDAVRFIGRSYALFTFYYLLGYIYLGSDVDRAKVLRIISYLTVIASLIGIVHYHFFYDYPFVDTILNRNTLGGLLYIEDPSLMRFRETSLYFGPNVFGYMQVFGTICFYYAFLYKPKISNIRTKLLYGFLALFFYSIFVTSSRSALMLFLVFIIMQIPRFNRKKYEYVMMGMILLAIVLFLAVLFKNFQLGRLIEEERVSKLLVLIDVLGENPLDILIGVPFGKAIVRDGVAFSDNLYGEFVLEGGVILLIAFFLFLTRVFKKIYKLQSNVNYLDERYLGATKYYLLFFLICGFFSTPLGMLFLFQYLGLLLGGAARMSESNALATSDNYIDLLFRAQRGKRSHYAGVRVNINEHNIALRIPSEIGAKDNTSAPQTEQQVTIG